MPCALQEPPPADAMLFPWEHPSLDPAATAVVFALPPVQLIEAVVAALFAPEQ
jgi:hypothetical protein